MEHNKMKKIVKPPGNCPKSDVSLKLLDIKCTIDNKDPKVDSNEAL